MKIQRSPVCRNGTRVIEEKVKRVKTGIKEVKRVKSKEDEVVMEESCEKGIGCGEFKMEGVNKKPKEMTGKINTDAAQDANKNGLENLKKIRALEYLEEAEEHVIRAVEDDKNKGEECKMGEGIEEGKSIIKRQETEAEEIEMEIVKEVGERKRVREESEEEEKLIEKEKKGRKEKDEKKITMVRDEKKEKAGSSTKVGNSEGEIGMGEGKMATVATAAPIMATRERGVNKKRKRKDGLLEGDRSEERTCEEREHTDKEVSSVINDREVGKGKEGSIEENG